MLTVMTLLLFTGFSQCVCDCGANIRPCWSIRPELLLEQNLNEEPVESSSAAANVSGFAVKLKKKKKKKENIVLKYPDVLEPVNQS